MQIKFKRIDDLKTDHDLKIREIADIIGVSVDIFLIMRMAEVIFL